MKNFNFMFDVDGVLSDRGMPIDLEFKNWFMQWSKFGQTLYYNTGSNREKTIQQIGKDMVDLAEISFHCLGNSVYFKDNGVTINSFELDEKESAWLLNKVNTSNFHLKVGHHIEHRQGSLNFSVIGRNANNEQRKIYKEYDDVNQERLQIVKEFMSTFPKYEAYIGGDISIDICLKECNKSLPLRLWLPNSNGMTYVFGDKGMEYGVDYPLNKFHRNNYHYVQINNGYKETWEYLKKFL